MAETIWFQNWATMRGNSTTTKAAQNEALYADLSRHRDLIVHLEVADFVGTPTLKLETSPTRDDALFQLIDAAASFSISSTGIYLAVLLYSTVAVPPARFVRWRFTGSATAPWSCTFRMVISPVIS